MGRYDRIMQDCLIPAQRVVQEALIEDPTLSPDAIKELILSKLWGPSGMYDISVGPRVANTMLISIVFLPVLQGVEATIEINVSQKEE